jgi:hypothetical protein
MVAHPAHPAHPHQICTGSTPTHPYQAARPPLEPTRVRTAGGTRVDTHTHTGTRTRSLPALAHLCTPKPRGAPAATVTPLTPVWRRAGAACYFWPTCVAHYECWRKEVLWRVGIPVSPHERRKLSSHISHRLRAPPLSGVARVWCSVGVSSADCTVSTPAARPLLLLCSQFCSGILAHGCRGRSSQPQREFPLGAGCAGCARPS